MIKSRIVAVLSALTLSSTGLVLAATPASAAESEMFKVIQANLGSGHDNVDVGVGNGVYDGHGSAEDPILAVSDKARAFGAHVITLQEVCSEDVYRMQVHLQNITGVAWTASTFARMQPSGVNNSCERHRGRPMEKGNVMFSRLGIYAGEDTVSYLGTHIGRTFTLGCMNVPFAGSASNGARTQVCNTHLPSGGDGAASEARISYAKKIKNGIAAATVNGISYSAHGGIDAVEQLVPTVFAGDLNKGLMSTEQDLFHRINRAGTGLNSSAKFWEADHEYGDCSYGYCRAAASTMDGTNLKYDYVYFGKKYGKGPGSVDLEVHGNPTGNHKIIYARSKFAW